MESLRHLCVLHAFSSCILSFTDSLTELLSIAHDSNLSNNSLTNFGAVFPALETLYVPTARFQTH
jgi:hypothetical protein